MGNITQRSFKKKNHKKILDSPSNDLYFFHNLQSTSREGKYQIYNTPGVILGDLRIRYGNIWNHYKYYDQTLCIDLLSRYELIINIHTGLKYSLKIYKKDNNNYLFNETQICLRIDHPFILKLIEIWENKNFVYLVSEYCAGGKLFDILSLYGRFSEERSSMTLREMLLAVYYLHENKIVHRNLNLDSWLLKSDTVDSTVRLTNFEFATIQSSYTSMSNGVCGNLLYCSPEALSGKYSNVSDSWSLGIIAHYLLTGHPPFYGDKNTIMLHLIEGMYNVYNIKYDFLSGNANNFLIKLLNFNASERMTVEDALNHPWIQSYAPKSKFPIRNSNYMEREAQTLISYQSITPLHGTVAMIASYSLAIAYNRDIINFFFEFNSKNKGFIDEVSFRNFMLLNSDLEESKIKSIFFNMCRNKSRCLYFSDFTVAFLPDDFLENKNILNYVFSKLVKDQSSTISVNIIELIMGKNINLKIKDNNIPEKFLNKGSLSINDFYCMLLSKNNKT